MSSVRDDPDLRVDAHQRITNSTKLDGISRSLADLLDLMKLFEQHGVKFVSLRDSIDTSGPVGRFMLHSLEAIAELERGITAARVAEDMKLRARRGHAVALNREGLRTRAGRQSSGRGASFVRCLLGRRTHNEQL